MVATVVVGGVTERVDPPPLNGDTDGETVANAPPDRVGAVAEVVVAVLRKEPAPPAVSAWQIGSSRVVAHISGLPLSRAATLDSVNDLPSALCGRCSVVGQRDLA